jgi:ribosomal protein L37AE/L43A
MEIRTHTRKESTYGMASMRTLCPSCGKPVTAGTRVSRELGGMYVWQCWKCHVFIATHVKHFALDPEKVATVARGETESELLCDILAANLRAGVDL